MGIITLKIDIFSIGKEWYESILILVKLWLMLSVIPLFSLKRYLILSQISAHPLWSNNTKYLIPSWILINKSVLSNLIHNGFVPGKVLYEMS